MDAMIRKAPALMVLALLCGTLAHAQSSTRQMLKPNTTPTVIPVWNVHSGQIEALLVLESNPQPEKRAWVKAAKEPNIVWPGQSAILKNPDPSKGKDHDIMPNSCSKCHAFARTSGDLD